MNYFMIGYLRIVVFRIFLSTAFIYLITSSNHRIRREAYNSLKRCTQNNAETVGMIFRKGLSQWVLNVGPL